MWASSSWMSIVTERFVRGRGGGDSSSSHESLPFPPPSRSPSFPSPISPNQNSQEEIVFEYGHPLRPAPSQEAVELPEEMNVEGFHYAVSSKKAPGTGKLMEDNHKAMTVNILLPADDPNSKFRNVKASFFGVFDGHGGWEAANFAAENIGHNIFNALLGEQLELAGESDINTANKIDLLSKKNLEEAVKAGYLRTDEEFLRLGLWGGSTCVTALIIDGNLVVSNAGDSRAVISRSRDGDSCAGEAEALTCDHKPGREDERERIEKLGGSVTDYYGISRVGPIAVSRAIGNGYMKKLVSSEPETRIIEILSDCEFVILASDGLWDVVGNQEAVDIARPFCLGEEHGDGLLVACKKLVEVAVARESIDDITVMIVQLQDFRKEGKMN